ncbi:MAG: glucosamine-6-phosphate deaminase [Clostridia bacterium]|nr:glucosamine-6-phosphate deaminase [Clostridia bacterium]
MNWIVVNDEKEMAKAGADFLLSRIINKPELLLGLATGSTPVGMYRLMIEAYRKGEADFSRVRTYNLDEYYPILKSDVNSYVRFMRKNLFDHINIPRENTHLPNGEAKDGEAEAKAYEAMIAEVGYMDVQLLGIGQNGHIGFNEPDDKLCVNTHVTALTENTVAANARFFDSPDCVPKHALTMGIGTIMKAKEILLLANGKNKHAAIEALKDDTVTTAIPATLLKLHPNVTIVCDKAAFEG